MSEFLEDAEGGFSATRLGFLAWLFGVLAAWVAASVSHRSLQPIPESVAAILGILMTGKVVQRFGEKTPSPPSPPNPPNVVVSGRTVVEG